MPSRTPSGSGAKRLGAILGGVVAVAGLIIGVLAWLNPDPSNAPSSMEERRPYLEAVDALCLRAGQQIPAFDETDQESILASMRAVPDIYRALLRDWAALDPPKQADVDMIRTQLDALESAARVAQAAMEAWDIAGPEAALQELEKYERYAEDFRRASRAYGLGVCPEIVGVS